MEATCISTSDVLPRVYKSATFIGKRKEKKKKKKISAGKGEKKKRVRGVDPSGDKLVLGRRAALCGRVRVRLVADDHFWRDA